MTIMPVFNDIWFLSYNYITNLLETYKSIIYYCNIAEFISSPSFLMHLFFINSPLQNMGLLIAVDCYFVPTQVKWVHTFVCFLLLILDMLYLIVYVWVRRIRTLPLVLFLSLTVTRLTCGSPIHKT